MSPSTLDAVDAMSQFTQGACGILEALVLDGTVRQTAYRLMHEMRERGASLPAHADGTTLTWELTSPCCTLSATVSVQLPHYDFLLNGVTTNGWRIGEEGRWSGTLKSLVEHVFHLFEGAAPAVA